MTDDIVARLRQEVVWEPEVGRMLAEAAREIERLRGEVVLWQAAATLTPAERDVIRDALSAVTDDRIAKGLRWILERLK